MIRALGRIRTDRALFVPGDEIPGLPASEEERLVGLGVAERMEEQPEISLEPEEIPPQEERIVPAEPEPEPEQVSSADAVESQPKPKAKRRTRKKAL